MVFGAAVLVFFFLILVLLRGNFTSGFVGHWAWVWQQGRRSGQQLPPSPPSLPFVGHLYFLLAGKGGLSHQFFASLAQRYGPILYLRMGALNSLVVSDAKIAKEVLRNHDLTFSSRPRLNIGRYILYKFQDLAFGDYIDKSWRDMKKVLAAEVLSSNKQFSPVTNEEVAWLVLTLSNVGCTLGKPFKLREYIMGFNYNIMTRVFMRKRYYGSYDKVEGKLGISFRKMIDVAISFGVLGTLSDFLPWLKFMDRDVSAMKKVFLDMDTFLQTIVDEHKCTVGEGGPKDYVDVMLATDFENKEDRTKSMLFDVFCGGTTATTLVEWTLAELLGHRELLAKVQAEIDTVVGQNRRVEESDINSLPYLQAVIKETFRLHPPLPMLIPHYSWRDCEVSGYHINAGTILYVNTYAIGRDNNLWEDPHEFRPERFLEENKGVDVLGHNFELLPFSSGRRGCPGMSLGLGVARLNLATLLHCFDWKVEKPVALTEGGEFLTSMADSLAALPVPRIPVHKLYRTEFCTDAID